MEFWERLCKRRKEMNWSQSELARQSGLTRAAICKWETPGNHAPSADALIKAAKALKSSPEFLLTGKNKRPALDQWGWQDHSVSPIKEFETTVKLLAHQWSELSEKDRKAVSRPLQKLKDLKIPQPGKTRKVSR